MIDLPDAQSDVELAGEALRELVRVLKLLRANASEAATQSPGTEAHRAAEWIAHQLLTCAAQLRDHAAKCDRSALTILRSSMEEAL